MKKEMIQNEVNERKGRLRYRMSWIFGILALVMLGYLIFEIVTLFVK